MPNQKLHDKLFRKSLSNLAIAKDFIATHVPQHVLAKFDINTIKFHKTSYVEDKLKEQKNQYRIDNSEIIKQRKTQYYLQNKDKINEKLKEKCTCICGISLRKSDLRRHEQSQKHINFIKIQNENSVNTIE